MPTQPALKFDAVPITCPVQEKYHAIMPCLAGTQTPEAQAQTRKVNYSIITRWAGIDIFDTLGREPEEILRMGGRELFGATHMGWPKAFDALNALSWKKHEGELADGEIYLLGRPPPGDAG
jgi:hypothetical protein